jgi:hypothetical protein
MSAAQHAPHPAPPAAPGNWHEAAGKFAEILGLDAALPEAVLRRAVVDSNFAHRLLVSRNAPRMLAALIADPANKRFGAPDERPEEALQPALAPLAPPGAPELPLSNPASNPVSNLALFGKATSALARWATTGFTHVDAAALERRLSACAACPHAQAAPDSLAYRAAGARGAGVCGLCGCPIARKARMSSEACPGVHPDDTAMTRWGEPIKA